MDRWAYAISTLNDLYKYTHLGVNGCYEALAAAKNMK